MRMHLAAALLLASVLSCEVADKPTSLGALGVSTDIPPGPICPSGGKSVSIGFDTNKDGTLGTKEVVDTTVICNGSDGLPGQPGPEGKNSLVQITKVDELCDRVDVGVDENADGVLGETEINPSQSAVVCDGIAGKQGEKGIDGEKGETGPAGHDALLLLTPEPIGDNCANGGIKLEVGIDANSNGKLDAAEVASGQTSYLCNGAKGDKGDQGDVGPPGGDGKDGAKLLILVEPVQPGNDGCPNGGSKVRIGHDANGDNQLGEDEINAALDTVICNGTNGQNGQSVQGNSPPTANAGPNQVVLLGAGVTLAGVANDVDGAVASHQWSQLSGPTVQINNPTSPTVSFTPTFEMGCTKSETLVFRLTATDDKGATATSDVVVVVQNDQLWRRYTTKDGLQSNGIFGIAEDADGNIWLALKSDAFGAGGVSKFDGVSFTNYTTQNSALTTSEINSVAVSPTGKVWIASDNDGGLVAFDRVASWTVYNTSNSGIAKNTVDEVMFRGNEVWIAGGDISVLDTSTSQWTIHQPFTGAKSLALDDKSQVWVASRYDGLAMYNDFSWAVFDKNNSNIRAQNLLVVRFDPVTKRIWAGSNGSGLSVLDGNSFENFTNFDSGLSHDQIQALAVDAIDGTLWIGTGQGGVSAFDGANWAKYHANNSPLPNNNLRAIFVDSKRRIWIGTTDHGLVMYCGD